MQRILQGLRCPIPGHVAAVTDRVLYRACCTRQRKRDGTDEPGIGHVFEREVTFDNSAVRAFLQVTGDNNAIHTCASAARARGFKDCLVPGMLCASLFPAIIGSTFPGAVYMMQDLKFRSPSLVGDTLLARVTVTAKSGSRIRFRTECLGPKDDVIITGSAMALMPRKEQGSST
ncbi:hypothetical protein CVIRNUC_008421 [Coccomyxa viridis]|uniref:MaoC-like domain-containing protein n=1 Tax=Coccomyxa viridis TaxID=1274662 RepID=A0AAV1IFI3_9CHLO|nr:hypothetical protein CVIRNUC_008421 [Coccomyxa viridis]